MPAKNRTKHNRKYHPWDKWLNPKRAITLKQGKHFTATQESMAVMIRTRALKENKRISVSKNDDGSLTLRKRVK